MHFIGSNYVHIASRNRKHPQQRQCNQPSSASGCCNPKPIVACIASHCTQAIFKWAEASDKFGLQKHGQMEVAKLSETFSDSHLQHWNENFWRKVQKLVSHEIAKRKQNVFPHQTSTSKLTMMKFKKRAKKELKDKKKNFQNWHKFRLWPVNRQSRKWGHDRI